MDSSCWIPNYFVSYYSIGQEEASGYTFSTFVNYLLKIDGVYENCANSVEWYERKNVS